MTHWIAQLAQFCQVPDGVLISLVKRGDKHAYGKLYVRYIDRIYRYMYFHLQNNREEAEDLTQLVFLKAWDNFSSFDGKNFSAWIYKIAHNTLIDKRRTSKRTETLRESLPAQKGGLEQLEQLANKELVMQALTTLGHEQRDVIILRYIEGYSTAEVAQVLKKSKVAIRAIQSRALKRMRMYLNSV